MTNIEITNFLMPYVLLIIGIVFLAYASVEPKCGKNTTYVGGKNEPIFYLYLALAAICFILFGWMLHS